jgi:hypothetical protein
MTIPILLTLQIGSRLFHETRRFRRPISAQNLKIFTEKLSQPCLRAPFV